MNNIWWLKPLKLDSWKHVQSWSMIVQYKQTLTIREIIREREDMNSCLPVGPDTCLSIIASCDRYPQGKAYTFIYARIEVGRGDCQTSFAKLQLR